MTNCEKVLTFKQYLGTCWFNALIMSLFYSQYSRKLLLEKSKTWDTTNEFLNRFKYIIEHKYIRNSDEDYIYFDDFKPEDILILLNKINSKKFFYNEKFVDRGGASEAYIRKIIKLMKNVSLLFLDYNKKQLHYSKYNNINPKIIEDKRWDHYKKIELQYNEKIKIFETKYAEYENIAKQYLNKKSITLENQLSKLRNELIPLKKETLELLIQKDELYDKIQNIILAYNKFKPIDNVEKNLKNNKNPDYLLVRLTNDEDYPIHYQYRNTDHNINTLQDNIYLNGYYYKLDSIILANFNREQGGHAISGVTCNDNKYIYNGWMKSTMDKGINEKTAKELPCELMKFDWNVKKSNPFCLNLTKCKLDLGINKKDLCFSFSKGKRLLIYVKQGKVDDIKPNKVVCPQDKILNPKTNRCVSKTGKIGKELVLNVPDIKPKKVVCPQDKILNPKTNRCVSKDGKIGKELLKK